jgi:hypothetical protein
MKLSQMAAPVPLLARPPIGNALTLLSGLSFFFLCMILPIVGPAAVHGSGSPGAGPALQLHQNYMAFTATLLVSLLIAGLAVYSKLERRKIDGSPLPFYSVGLLVVLVLMAIAFATGLFAI